MKRIYILIVLMLAACTVNAQNATKSNTVKSLETWLANPTGKLSDQSFAKKSLTADEAKEAFNFIYNAKSKEFSAELAQQWQNKCLELGKLRMKFDYRIYGDCPEDGRSLYISMHGGGGTRPEINDQQWRNQIRLYRPAEGVYLAPRAAVDAWNMWSLPHLDTFFMNIINMAVLELNVNPDKVYITGYSAGGDGTWRMAPRMADSWAASAMMAGHPGGVKLVNLRNTPFQIWMGENDGAYDRNKCAVVEGAIMDSLQKNDPEGYIHETHIVPGVGHWMNRADTAAIPWMAQYKRNPYPTKIVWRQDGDCAHTSFYWLKVNKTEASVRDKTVVIELKNNVFTITRNDYQNLTICLNDKMIDFSKPVIVIENGKTIFKKKVSRTIEDIEESLDERMDKSMNFCAHITLIK